MFRPAYIKSLGYDMSPWIDKDREYQEREGNYTQKKEPQAAQLEVHGFSTWVASALLSLVFWSANAANVTLSKAAKLLCKTLQLTSPTTEMSSK